MVQCKKVTHVGVCPDSRHLGLGDTGQMDEGEKVKQELILVMQRMRAEDPAGYRALRRFMRQLVDKKSTKSL